MRPGDYCACALLYRGGKVTIFSLKSLLTEHDSGSESGPNTLLYARLVVNGIIVSLAGLWPW